MDKTYTATARFGAVSDTLDADGNITPLQNAPMPDEPALLEAAERLTGDILQTPPMASAVKVKGERLYKAHRRGETIERGSRSATVHAFELLSMEGDTATFHVSCSSGTYVRTLLSDLALSLGTDAYVTALRRTSVGNISTETAIQPDDHTPETVSKCIIQPTMVVSHIPGVEISEEERSSVCNGRRLGEVGRRGIFRVEVGGELLAIYRDDGEGGGARAEVVLCAP